MKRWFVLSQGPQASTVDCYQWNNDKIVHHGSVSPDVLKKQAGDEPIVLVLTSNQWSCIDVLLPKIKLALLRKALPHMVEEAILSGADEIHCVLPSHYTLGESCTVMVVSRELMQAWRDWVRLHDLNLEAMIPAYTLLPITNGHMGMMVYEHSLWIRYSETKGYCLDYDEVKILMPKLITCEHLDLFGDIEETIKNQFSSVHTQMLRLKDCLQQTDHFPINLLQADFKPRQKQHSTRFNTLSLSLGLFVFALILHVLYLGVSYTVLHSRLSELQQEALSLYQKVYPEATVVSSPKVLMTRALNHEGGAGEYILVDLLSTLSRATVDHPMILQQLDYRDRRLTVTGTVSDFTHLEFIMQTLKMAGYAVEQQKAQQTENHVEVTILMSREGT